MNSHQKKIISELRKCQDDFVYFMETYCKIYDNKSKSRIPLVLWRTDPGEYDNQFGLVQKIQTHNRVICLKARQMGVTWICLCYFLWLAIFHPIEKLLLLSKGELEAKQLMKRVRGLIDNLPQWMRPSEESSSQSHVTFKSESEIRSLSTQGGDSFTATGVLIDEADLVHRAGTSLKQMLLNIEPTVGQDGKLILISKSDKKHPFSYFKKIFKASYRNKDHDFEPVFIPYFVHPDRSVEWRDRQIANEVEESGHSDKVFENYPANPNEALRSMSSGKRFSPKWIEQCYLPKEKVHVDDELEDIYKVRFYHKPDKAYDYLFIADPAKGLPDSDPSAFQVINITTMEQVAVCNERHPVELVGHCAIRLAEIYNNAFVLWERNNHGHALEMWLKNRAAEGKRVRMIPGYDSSARLKKLGWPSNKKSKAIAAEKTALVLRSKGITIHDEETKVQLENLESDKLAAPSGEYDDLADNIMVTCGALELCPFPVWGDIRFSG